MAALEFKRSDDYFIKVAVSTFAFDVMMVASLRRFCLAAALRSASIEGGRINSVRNTFSI